MKKFIIVLALGCLSLPMHALAADQSSCNKAAKGFADIVPKVRQLPASEREQFLLDRARDQDFKTVGSKLAGRMINLVNTSLSPREIQTDIYAYCMNL